MQKNISNYPNAFYPLDGKVDISQFAQFKVGYGEFKGKHYSVPFDNGATATFIRTDILEKAGLKPSDFNDITWRQFLELGKIVKAKAGVPLLSYVGTEPDCIFIMLQSAGKWVFDENGNPSMVGNEALKEAVSVYSEMKAFALQFLTGTHTSQAFRIARLRQLSTDAGLQVQSQISRHRKENGQL